MGKNLLSKATGGINMSDDFKLEDSLFDRLCPLLIIRLLPLRVFNDLNSSVMYSRLLNEDTVDGKCIIM